jgi:hypothetical protein
MAATRAASIFSTNDWRVMAGPILRELPLLTHLECCRVYVLAAVAA